MKQHNALAERYAQALFDLSLHHDKVDTVGQQLLNFRELLDENTELKHIFVSPIFSNIQREKVVRSIVEKAGYDKEVLNFLLLLIEKKRSALFSDIQESFQAFGDKHYKRLHVYVTMPKEPSDEFLKELSQKISDESKHEVILHTDIDESLFGGAIVRVGDKMLDGSLKSRIEGMREGLLQQV